jgi:16S rRNA (cytosine1402-N4)-methyltransferase
MRMWQKSFSPGRKTPRKNKLTHIPVLLNQVLEYLLVDPDGTYIDATVGGGGHSEGILKKLSSKGKLICIDRDEDALRYSKKRLEKFGHKVSFFKVNFGDLSPFLIDLRINNISGFLFDLGLSSLQLENPERGFSYLKEGPLDMRMDTSQTKKALAVVNLYSAYELSKIFFQYGEERYSRPIAQEIVKRRKQEKIKTTKQLKDAIESEVNPKYRIKSLSRIFQAIRIEVNDELQELEKGLNSAVGFLRPNGRICVITYHSLEDRLVKFTFNRFSKGCICPPEFPKCICGKEASKELEILTKKPIRPETEEIERNPKARSAKLRVAERSALN